VRWPSGRRRRFAKAARDHRTGLESTISGPFFIGNLVGVGCRMMVFGPRFGTLVGTLQPMPCVPSGRQDRVNEDATGAKPSGPGAYQWAELMRRTSGFDVGVPGLRRAFAPRGADRAGASRPADSAPLPPPCATATRRRARRSFTSTCTCSPGGALPGRRGKPERHTHRAHH